VRAAADSDQDIVGIRFENDQIVGEYFLHSQQTPEAFLSEFTERYGTVPQVAGLIVEVPRRLPEDKTRHVPLPVIDTGSIDFVAPEIPEAKLDELFLHEQPAAEDASAARFAFPYWEPEQVFVRVWRTGSSQKFTNSIYWNTTTYPQLLTGPKGIEIEVTLVNEATGVRGSILPWELCGPGFRDEFIAKNYNWNSWSVSSPHGSLAASYPYADLNDLFDSCGENVMAIGFASPYDMPTFYDGPYADLETYIDAQVGVRSSSTLFAGLQLVDSSWCPFDGSIAFTDCMGLFAPSLPSGWDEVRATLAEWRGWVAATDKCWYSASYGTVAPSSYTC